MDIGVPIELSKAYVLKHTPLVSKSMRKLLFTLHYSVPESVDGSEGTVGSVGVVGSVVPESLFSPE